LQKSLIALSRIPLLGKFILKIPILGVGPHFVTHNGEIWHEGTKLRLHPPSQILFKNRLRGYTLSGKIYTKNTNFSDFGAVIPHVNCDNSEIWREGTDLGTLPALNFVKIA